MKKPRIFKRFPLNKAGVPQIGFFQSLFAEGGYADESEHAYREQIPKVRLGDRGPKWTDFIGEARGDVAVLVSGRVVAGFRASGMECVDATPANLARIPLKLRNQRQDQYHVFDTNRIPMSITMR